MENAYKKRIVITGGAGFIGSHLAEGLLSSGWDAVVLDDNNFPALIDNLQEFLEEISNVYNEATREYADKYNDIRVKRKISDIVEL